MPEVSAQRTTTADLVAERLARLRKSAEPPMSYDGLAAAMEARGCRIHPTALHKVENGIRKITVDELVAVSEVFNVGLDFLTARPTDPAARRAEEVLDQLQRTRAKSRAVEQRLDALRKKINRLEADLTQARKEESTLQIDLEGLLMVLPPDVAAAIRGGVPSARPPDPPYRFIDGETEGERSYDEGEDDGDAGVDDR